jgi:hypothetical protein
MSSQREKFAALINAVLVDQRGAVGFLKFGRATAAGAIF